MVLDGGAAGVIAPYVETAGAGASSARRGQAAAHQGARSSNTCSAATPVEPELDAYVRNGAEDRLLIVNIESGPAIEALDEILAVPGLDAVLIGPHDLSCNLGVPERYDHPDFLGACETIFRKARAAGVGAGIHFWGEIEQQAHFLKLGANLLIHSADITLFKSTSSANWTRSEGRWGRSFDRSATFPC